MLLEHRALLSRCSCDNYLIITSHQWLGMESVHVFTFGFTMPCLHGGTRHKQPLAWRHQWRRQWLRRKRLGPRASAFKVRSQILIPEWLGQLPHLAIECKFSHWCKFKVKEPFNKGIHLFWKSGFSFSLEWLVWQCHAREGAFQFVAATLLWKFGCLLQHQCYYVLLGGWD